MAKRKRSDLSPNSALSAKDVVAAFLVGLAELNRELLEHRRFAGEIREFFKQNPQIEQKCAEFQRKMRG